jgi:hypothetical protein
MKPKDDSDDTLLVFSDYLEETGEIKQAEELREVITYKETNQWHRSYEGYHPSSFNYQFGGGTIGGMEGNFRFETQGNEVGVNYKVVGSKHSQRDPRSGTGVGEA